ncbi:MAG: hypothetical protein PHS53_00050 [Candidatus Pacebacteria bacterium]|nr:hypothetical protein [Candidatus Paceibacterota bacterium]MDD5356527.1 hypothetical protein [Candidatus Paceibacterota bacterium]
MQESATAVRPRRGSERLEIALREMPSNDALVRLLVEHGFVNVTGKCDLRTRQVIRKEEDPSRFGRYSVSGYGPGARIVVVDFDGEIHMAKGSEMPDELKMLVKPGNMYIPEPKYALKNVQ